MYHYGHLCQIGEVVQCFGCAPTSGGSRNGQALAPGSVMFCRAWGLCTWRTGFLSPTLIPLQADAIFTRGGKIFRLRSRRTFRPQCIVHRMHTHRFESASVQTLIGANTKGAPVWTRTRPLQRSPGGTGDGRRAPCGRGLLVDGPSLVEGDGRWTWRDLHPRGSGSTAAPHACQAQTLDSDISLKADDSLIRYYAGDALWSPLSWGLSRLSTGACPQLTSASP
jgi:hypothetical protein